MPESIIINAYAKVNLSLDITGKGPCGYHTLETVMQSVSIADTLTLKKNCEGIEVICSNEQLSGENNLAFKAAREFFEYCEIPTSNQNIKIKIKKEIPVSGGLGGGSADAAAVLVAMNSLFLTDLDEDELCEIAIKVGADVPFCIKGGTQLAEGIGGILTPLPDLSDCFFALVCCGSKPSTAEMYKRYDALAPESITHPETAKIIDCICKGSAFTAAAMFDNVFAPLYGDEFLNIKHRMLQASAISVSLSGSGPMALGVFESEEQAQKCRLEMELEDEQMIICTPKCYGNKIK